jgi:hypothetical protein
MVRPYPEIVPQLHSLDINTINIVESTLAARDSALLAKFENQLHIYDLFDKDSGVLPDSNFVNVFGKKLTAISVGDLRSELAGRLDSKTTLNVSTIIFWIICIILALLAFIKQWSLIPLLGLTTCLYLLTGMTKANWLWFGGWLAIGLIIYFLYGYRKSKLVGQQ